MKICPKCKGIFPDELYFCLDDGTTLTDTQNYIDGQNPTLSQKATVQLPSQIQTAQPEVLTKQQRVAAPTFGIPTKPKSNLPLILGGVFGLILLTSIALVGSYFMFRPITEVNPPSTRPSYTPYSPTPTPKPEDMVKVEVLEKTSNSFGQKFLKCKVTNISEKIIEVSNVKLTFYQDNVKIRDAAEILSLKFLKPNQTIPVWINLYGADKYTTVKPEVTLSPFATKKTTEQLYPKLEFTQTEMTSEMGNMMINFRNFRKLYYKVAGIVENKDYPEISTEIFVLFYDEKSEIVGIGSTGVYNLKQGEKSKFEVQKVETDLFGKPTKFETLVISK